MGAALGEPDPLTLPVHLLYCLMNVLSTNDKGREKIGSTCAVLEKVKELREAVRGSRGPTVDEVGQAGLSGEATFELRCRPGEGTTLWKGGRTHSKDLGQSAHGLLQQLKGSEWGGEEERVQGRGQSSQGPVRARACACVCERARTRVHVCLPVNVFFSWRGTSNFHHIPRGMSEAEEL